MTARTRWESLGTTAELVVAEPSRLFAARVAVERELQPICPAAGLFTVRCPRSGRATPTP